MNGAPLCNSAPCTRDLPEGRLHLEVTAPGASHPEAADTYVIPDKSKRLQIVFQELPPLPPPAPLRAGTAVITLATPGAGVHLYRSLPSAMHQDITAALGDGSQPFRMSIPPGQLWTLAAFAEGREPFARDILFEHDGDESPIAVALEVGPPDGKDRPWSVMPFGKDFTRPTQLAGMFPAYTRKALEARQEGKVIARCVLTTLGFLVDCRIEQSSAPLQNDAVLAALTTHRYTPAMFRGHPQAVFYTLPFNFKLPP
jgi:protein TonB